MKDIWENPYPWHSIHHWCYKIRQPSNPAHRLFWGWGVEREPGHYSIYWLGVITLWWNDGIGWTWSWNFD